MSRPNVKARGRVLLAGKVIFNFGQSTINCMVRRITDDGATIEVESGLGVPETFQLSISSEGLVQPCRVAWRSEKEIGLTFDGYNTADRSLEESSKQGGAENALRADTLALRAALDHAPLGVVLLDARLNARFINRAFRQMWALPDDKADRHPSFAALMFHGRDTGAYEIPSEQLDAYVAGRIEQIQKSPNFVLDLRRAKGDVVRMQCTPVPDGGRMLTYTEVTDIVRQSDELKLLRDALENVQDGVLLLDSDLHATFMNRKVKQFWELSDQEAASRPFYGSLITRARRAVQPNIPGKELAGFAAKRVAEVRAGWLAPIWWSGIDVS
jgi:PAS domain-containing protein